MLGGIGRLKTKEGKVRGVRSDKMGNTLREADKQSDLAVWQLGELVGVKVVRMPCHVSRNITFI